MAEIEKGMGEILEDKDKIRGIFVKGTKEEIDQLLALEKAPEIAEDTRDLITEVREELEKHYPHIGVLIWMNTAYGRLNSGNHK